ncbi:MAG: alkaline phosphatase family protein, partial [Clostridia bacterium]|nr:alkaline phosphatase family protein [Clostridia bacterium]
MPLFSQRNIVVYINWDGFAKYYLDLAEAQGKVPTLSRIKNEDGIFFANAMSGIPAITNPMQAVLASGTTPRFTGNHYRYFDKQQNRVVQEEPARRNEAETLAEAVVRQGVKAFAINQFAFLHQGTGWAGREGTYFNASPGVNGYADYNARFDEAIRFLRAYAEKKSTGGSPERQAPFLLALYMDDLDAIGHNMKEV